MKEILRELVSQFFLRESNRTSLITITNIELRDRGALATILVTVLPEDREAQVIDFMHRQLTELRDYVKEHARLMRIPYFEVKIDVGEKNRQRIDEIEKKL